MITDDGIPFDWDSEAEPIGDYIARLEAQVRALREVAKAARIVHKSIENFPSLYVTGIQELGKALAKWDALNEQCARVHENENKVEKDDD